MDLFKQLLRFAVTNDAAQVSIKAGQYATIANGSGDHQIENLGVLQPQFVMQIMSQLFGPKTQLLNQGKPVQGIMDLVGLGEVKTIGVLMPVPVVLLFFPKGYGRFENIWKQLSPPPEKPANLPPPPPQAPSVPSQQRAQTSGNAGLVPPPLPGQSQGLNVNVAASQDLSVPPQNLNAPPQNLNAPPQNLNAPPQNLNAPPQNLNAPPQNLNAPPQNLNAPPQNLNAPPQNLSAPPQNLSAPPQNLSAPPQNLSAPPQNLSAPSQNLNAPPQGIVEEQLDLSTPPRSMGDAPANLGSPLSNVSSALEDLSGYGGRPFSAVSPDANHLNDASGLDELNAEDSLDFSQFGHNDSALSFDDGGESNLGFEAKKKLSNIVSGISEGSGVFKIPSDVSSPNVEKMVESVKNNEFKVSRFPSEGTEFEADISAIQAKISAAEPVAIPPAPVPSAIKEIPLVSHSPGSSASEVMVVEFSTPKSELAISSRSEALDHILEEMLQRGASDLHLSCKESIIFRMDGEVVKDTSKPTVTPEIMEKMLLPIMPPRNKKEFIESHDTDFAYEIPGKGRFRVNVFRNRNGVGSVMRHIPSKILTASDLNLNSTILEFCKLHKGLVLVTGPTGSGKSTTLAAMIDHINKNRAAHVITIEDPIEFVYQPEKCLINQREVGRHTLSFAKALRAALREDPDIVLVGELRDLETVKIAIETAETGHLVFGTLHTNTAISTVDRIVDQFPAEQQQQIRIMLAESLKGVVSQTLLKKIGKGRVAAQEIMVVNRAISAILREGKTQMLGNQMTSGRKEGNVLLNEVLLNLVLNNVVDASEAYMKAVDKAEFLSMLNAKGVSLQQATEVAS